MNRRRRVPLLGRATAVVLCLLVAACSGAGAKGPSGGDPCDPEVLIASPLFDPVAACHADIAAADGRLGIVHWPVSAVRLVYDLCPPNARCAARVPGPRPAWVVYTFWLGDPAMIQVSPEGSDELVAGEPEPLPDWLLEQMQGKSG